MDHVCNRRIGRAAGVGLVAVLLLLSHHAAAQAPKPCGFFTKQAAESIFGAPLDPGRDTVMSCTYSGVDGDDQKGLMVNVIPSSGASAGMNMPETYDNLIHQDPTSTQAPLDGLGNKAHYITSKDHSQVAVEVLYHNTIVGIMATSSPNPKLKVGTDPGRSAMMQKL